MNLSIEDLEAIKAIVREVVKEELARVIRDAQTQQAAYAEALQQQAEVAKRVAAAKEAAAMQQTAGSVVPPSEVSARINRL